MYVEFNVLHFKHISNILCFNTNKHISYKVLNRIEFENIELFDFPSLIFN